ncbi:ubiquitin carboxyl-terminal hydrolase 37-like [Centruroides sculpturatus]|uniref:ubiquitin carboxyl-terminal hydrolase 37-like n=1 Tax=Centruroides sculpturatus TaxID=218467 RepID=UPI000C6D436E|nr:ubiquitin carboxyl-terminal hydrolase 37-like [Centruroides sculpturatus]XP_023232747.1 ubiquitin carboxyl-terminal hydrolase 37-like [Centruroides sculpturatus]
MVLRPKFHVVEVHGDVRYAGSSIGSIRWRQGYLKIVWNKEELVWWCHLYFEAKNRIPAFQHKLTQKNLQNVPKSSDNAEKNGFIHVIFKNHSNIWIRRNNNTYSNSFYVLANLLREIKDGYFSDSSPSDKRSDQETKSHNNNNSNDTRWNDTQQKSFYSQHSSRSSASRWNEMLHHQNRNFERSAPLKTYSRSNWSSHFRNRCHAENDLRYNSTYRQKQLSKHLQNGDKQAQTNSVSYSINKGGDYRNEQRIKSDQQQVSITRLSREDSYASNHQKENTGVEISRSPLKSISSNHCSSVGTPKRPLLNFSVASKRLKRSTSPFKDEEIDLPSPEICDKSPKLQGFENLGNSCYMNSILQALFSLNCFTESMLRLNDLIGDKLSETSLFRCITSLLLAKMKGDYSQSQSLLEHIKDAVCVVAPNFKGNYQHDAHEFLGQVLDQMKEEVYSICEELNIVNPVEENFEFKLLNSYLCQGCFEMVTKKQPTNMLSLDVPKLQNADVNGSLQDSLDIYFLPQNLEFKCEKCQHMDSRCVETFATLPRILILHLKRYSYVQQSVKVAQPVTIPTYLSLYDHTNENTLSVRPLCNFHRNENNLEVSIKSEKEFYADSILKQSGNAQLLLNDSNSNKSNAHKEVELSVNISTVIADNVENISLSENSFYGDVRRMTTSRVQQVGLCGGREDEANIPSIGEEEKENHLPNGHLHDSSKAITLYSEVEPDFEGKDMQNAVKQSLQEAESQEELELQRALQNSIEEVSEWSSEENHNSEDSGEFWIHRNEEEKKMIEENFESGHLPHSYQLVSIVSHIGQTAHSGHYLCDAYDNAKDCWWHFNDDVVQKKTKYEVFQQRETTGYLFFYVAKEILQRNCSRKEKSADHGC